MLNKTALIVTTEKGNAEIVQLLLSRPELDVNHISIFKKLFFLSNFYFFFFNFISNSIISITFSFKFSMKFFYHFFHKAALHVAAEIGSTDIVKLLLSRPEINVNLISI